MFNKKMASALLCYISIMLAYGFSTNVLAQTNSIQRITIIKNTETYLQKNESSFDKNLVITSPLLGSNVNGKIKITGKAAPNSSVKIEVKATYYKYTANYKTKKLNRGEGPIVVDVKNIIVQTNNTGFWTTNPVNFNNYGFSTTFKIVARSVEGKNATYVTVQNNKLPNVAWD